jgi:dihydroorotase-like cyclic amidohydrolase
MMLVESEGFSEAEIRRMTATNPAALFGVPD